MLKIKKFMSIVSLATALLAISAIPVSAHNDVLQNLSEMQARTLAQNYLNSLGYNRVGVSDNGARVGKAHLENGLWVVDVRIGGRFGKDAAVVLVLDSDGKIVFDK